MKFTLENMGPIKKAEVELGDLTIIAGKNNTGKTYIAYTLYGFLSQLYEAFPGDENRKASNYAYRRIERYTDINVSKRARLEIKPDSQKNKVTVSEENGFRYSKEMLNEIGRLFSHYDISNIFSSGKEQFQKSRFTCELSSQEGRGHISLSRYIAQFTAPTKQKPFFTILFRDADIPPKLMRRLVKRELLYYFLTDQCGVSPFILPAERFGVSLFYKELDFTKNRLVEALQSLSDEKVKSTRWFFYRFGDVIDKSARYAQPIKDYIDFIRGLDDIQKGKSDFADSKFFDDIKNMMEAYYRHSDNDIRFISKKIKNGAFNIPLHLASSSGRGLAGFYFYLKHTAKKGQLLIIDEPESHLDTNNQILLARLLARCVNSGIKVLITTHSDYLIKEFNNLIMLSHEFEDKERLMKKFKYGEEDSLKAESIKAYVCEKSGMTPCQIYHRGIDMPVFDKTIDSINEVASTFSLRMPEDE